VGFVKQKKIFKLVWDKTSDYPGLVVRAGSLSTGDMLKITNLARFAEDADNVGAEQISEMFQTFALALVDWNLEEEVDGEVKAVPATIDGLYAQDFDFVMEIINRWMASITNVPDGLGKESTSGDQSLEASIPMDEL
jgi:hypothetical protein